MTFYRPIRKSIYRLLAKPFYKRYSKQSQQVVFQKPCRLTGKQLLAALERKRVTAYQDSINRYNLLQQGIRARKRFDKQQARMKTEAAKKEKEAAKRAKEANQRLERACKRQQQQKQQQQQQLEEAVPDQHTILTDLFTGFNLIH
jgi:uncharacterized protein YdaU (DUF1376 family)